MISYLQTIPEILPKQVIYILDTIDSLRIPIHCIVTGIYFFERCLTQSNSHVYTRLSAALYLGYRIHHDRYSSIKKWGYLTRTRSIQIVRYETKILKSLEYRINIDQMILDNLFFRLSNLKMLNLLQAPMSPVSPILSPMVTHFDFYR